LKANLDWAEEEERKEHEAMLLKLEKDKQADKEWMQQELAKAKKEYGDDYGEDISVDFSE